LLHLYFAKKEDKECEYLRRFTYETRSSSREFCEKLVDYDIDFSKEKISTYIKDSNWFMPFWENDPTVKSMLVMIDEIHHKFKDAKFYDKLENIKFSFIELKDFGLTDDLYIKMNARGKPLSEFENFKAEFEKELSQDIKTKLDNQWLDLFWNLNSGDKDEIGLSNVDKRYMAFFNRVASNFTILSIKDTKEAKDFNFDSNDKNIIKIERTSFVSPPLRDKKNKYTSIERIIRPFKKLFFLLSIFILNFPSFFS